MNLPELDLNGMISFLTELLETPSPTGFTEQAIQLCEEQLAQLPGIVLERTRKGALVATLPGDGGPLARINRPCGHPGRDG